MFFRSAFQSKLYRYYIYTVDSLRQSKSKASEYLLFSAVNSLSANVSVPVNPSSIANKWIAI